MELEKALLSITSIVIVVLFMGMAMQPATTHSNQRTVSVSAKQEIEYDRYFIQKPVNVSDQFSNMFITWIGNYEHGNPYAGGKVSAFHIPSQAQVKELVLYYQTLPDINENSAFMVVARTLASEAQGIAGKIGWDSWGTES